MSEGTNSVRVRIRDTNQVDDFIRLVKIFERVFEMGDFQIPDRSLEMTEGGLCPSICWLNQEAEQCEQFCQGLLRGCPSGFHRNPGNG